MTWPTRFSRIVYENRWISVREDAVTMPDGSAGLYDVVTVRATWAEIGNLIRSGELHDSDSMGALTMASIELGWA